MATKRDLLEELKRYRQAARLLSLGARVPVVYELTRLSNWFLRKLSRQICGTGPRKGQIPNSELWYLRARNNLQASMFMAIHSSLRSVAGNKPDPCELLISAFEQYCVAVESSELKPVLTLDRAWWLLKSIQIRNLKLMRCTCCGGSYVAHYGDLDKGYVCTCCRVNPPQPRIARSRDAGRAVATW